MAKDFSRAFYNTEAWVNTREAYKKSVGGLCELCWANGIAKAGELVHHKTELTPENITNTDITLGWDNLQCVCRECHAKIHGLHFPVRKNGKRYKIDENGNVIFIHTPPLSS